MAPLTAGFWPFGYPASGPKYATPRTSRPPACLGNHFYCNFIARVRFFERRYLKAHQRLPFAVAQFSGFIPAHGLRSKTLFRRTLKTGHVYAPGLDIALKNASIVQRYYFQVIFQEKSARVAFICFFFLSQPYNTQRPPGSFFLGHSQTPASNAGCLALAGIEGS